MKAQLEQELMKNEILERNLQEAELRLIQKEGEFHQSLRELQQQNKLLEKKLETKTQKELESVRDRNKWGVEKLLTEMESKLSSSEELCLQLKENEDSLLSQINQLRTENEQLRFRQERDKFLSQREIVMPMKRSTVTSHYSHNDRTRQSVVTMTTNTALVENLQDLEEAKNALLVSMQEKDQLEQELSIMKEKAIDTILAKEKQLIELLKTQDDKQMAQKQEFQRLQSEVVILKSELQIKTKECSQLGRELELTNEHLELQKSKYEELHAKYLKNKQNLKKHKQAKDSLQSHIQKQEDLKDVIFRDLQENEERLREAFTDKHAVENELKQRLREKEEDLKEKKLYIKELKEQLNIQQNQCKQQYSEEKDKTTQKLKQLQEKLQRKKQKLYNTQNYLDQLQIKLEDLQQQLQEQQQKEDTLNQLLESLTTEMSEKEEQMAERIQQLEVQLIQQEALYKQQIIGLKMNINIDSNYGTATLELDNQDQLSTKFSNRGSVKGEEACLKDELNMEERSEFDFNTRNSEWYVRDTQQQEELYRDTYNTFRDTKFNFTQNQEVQHLTYTKDLSEEPKIQEVQNAQQPIGNDTLQLDFAILGQKYSYSDSFVGQQDDRNEEQKIRETIKDRSLNENEITEKKSQVQTQIKNVDEEDEFQIGVGSLLPVNRDQCLQTDPIQVPPQQDKKQLKQMVNQIQLLKEEIRDLTISLSDKELFIQNLESQLLALQDEITTTKKEGAGLKEFYSKQISQLQQEKRQMQTDMQSQRKYQLEFAALEQKYKSELYDERLKTRTLEQAREDAVEQLIQQKQQFQQEINHLRIQITTAEDLAMKTKLLQAETTMQKDLIVMKLDKAQKFIMHLQNENSEKDQKLEQILEMQMKQREKKVSQKLSGNISFSRPNIFSRENKQQMSQDLKEGSQLNQ